MSRRTQIVFTILALSLAPWLPDCRAEEERDRTTTDSDGIVVREIFVRSSERDEPQVFFIQDGSEVQPGVIKLRSKLHEGGFLGVHMIELGPELRDHFGVPGDRGLMVSRVVESSPAADAGVQVGDILLRADGQDLDSTLALQERIRAKVGGETLALELLRDGEIQTLSPALADSTEYIDPQALFELHVESGPVGPIYRFGLHCAEMECPRLVDEETLDDAMVRLRELLESGELSDEIHTRDPHLTKRIELLERRLEAVQREIDEESDPD